MGVDSEQREGFSLINVVFRSLRNGAQPLCITAFDSVSGTRFTKDLIADLGLPSGREERWAGLLSLLEIPKRLLKDCYHGKSAFLTG